MSSFYLVKKNNHLLFPNFSSISVMYILGRGGCISYVVCKLIHNKLWFYMTQLAGIRKHKTLLSGDHVQSEKKSVSIHCPKSNPNFRELTRNVEENEIIHEIFRVVSCFPCQILCYTSETWIPLGQCGNSHNIYFTAGTCCCWYSRASWQMIPLQLI